MKCDKKNMLLYAVTDRAWTKEKSLYEQVEEALKGGITCLQLREKNLSKEEILEEALKIGPLCKKYGVPFIINDDVEIAIKCGADGVHVGQDDMEAGKVRAIAGDNLIIGVSAHSVEEALKAEAAGADYLGVGAMFSTSTKTNVRPMTKEILSDICRSVSIPVVAIGGIGKGNIGSLHGSGADGVAVVSAIFAAKDIEAECKILRKLSEEMVNS